ncbi:hypothetical protein ABK040_006323 [Willaertia magna]
MKRQSELIEKETSNNNNSTQHQQQFQLVDDIPTRYFRTRSGSFDLQFFKEHLSNGFEKKKLEKSEKRDFTKKEYLCYGLFLTIIPLCILTFFFLSFFCFSFPNCCKFSSNQQQENNNGFYNIITWWFINDKYMKFLIPMIVPIIIIFRYFNWRSFQQFRHN